MHPLATLLVLTALGCAGAVPRATSARVPAIADRPSDSGELLIASPLPQDLRVELLSVAWTEREEIFGDGAVLDRRSVYMLLDRADVFETQLAPAVRNALYGDTTPYEQHPRAPARLRQWSVRSIERIAADRVHLLGQLNVGPRQHRERISLVFAGNRWQVTKIEIEGFVFY